MVRDRRKQKRYRDKENKKKGEGGIVNKTFLRTDEEHNDCYQSPYTSRGAK
jgi:hypothetical protein